MVREPSVVAHHVRDVVEGAGEFGPVVIQGPQTGEDLIRALEAEPAGPTRYLLPDACLNKGRFLDGLTLADLILGRDTSRTALPWVGHRSRSWEPEPLRWLGVRSVYALYRAADRAEGRRPSVARSSRWAVAADRIAGRS